MDRNLIVAKYQEDLSWLAEVQGYDVIVYDKYDTLSSNHIPNIGREAHTYIHHIIKNYDKLATINVFTQGDPFVHCMNFINNLNLINEKYKYFEFSNITITCDKNGLPAHELPIESFFDLIFPEYICPNSFSMKGNAIFCVHKERILYHPIEFYQNIMKNFEVFDKAAWILERLWSLIFSGKLMPSILSLKSTSSIL
jgi:hypothetical protein